MNMTKRPYIIENQEMMSKWNFEKNKQLGLFPDKLTCGSNKMAWWTCDKDKRHVFSAKICHIFEGRIVCPICSNQKILVGVNDLATTNPELLNEWNYEKNEITPQQATYGKNRKVWWKCSVCGREWQATIASRASYQKTGCPHCKKELSISVSEKTLAYYLSQYFDIEENVNFDSSNKMELDIYIPALKIGIEYDGRQWHRDVEKDLKKDELCLQHGIDLIRVREKGCPEYISNATFLEVEVIHDTIAHLKDIVETTFDYINKRYNASLNISPNIESDYFDILNKALTFSKTSKKSLAETDLMQDWNYEKNRDLDPRKLTLGMHVKVWWKCHVCGHEWAAMVYSRANGCGCNACFGHTCVTGVNDLQTLAPHLLVDWDYEKNELSPNQICARSNKKYWWKCHVCGHEWQSTAAHRFDGRGCMVCGRERTTKCHCKRVINIDTGIEYDSIKAAAKSLNLSADAIANCCRNISKTSGGYHWRFIDEK